MGHNAASDDSSSTLACCTYMFDQMNVSYTLLVSFDSVSSGCQRISVIGVLRLVYSAPFEAKSSSVLLDRRGNNCSLANASITAYLLAVCGACYRVSVSPPPMPYHDLPKTKAHHHHRRHHHRC
jgi:hypothetical protein